MKLSLHDELEILRIEQEQAKDLLADVMARIKVVREKIAAPRRKALEEEKKAAHARAIEASKAATNKRLDIFRMKLSGAKAKDVAEKYGIGKAYASDLLRYSKSTAYYIAKKGELKEGDPILLWYKDIQDGIRDY